MGVFYAKFFQAVVKIEKHTKRYTLLTAITMIVGICIGSGIFFKTDNILYSTGGSVTKGIAVFVLGAVSIIFGALCFGELAKRTDGAGGVVAYADKFCGSRAACVTGWFMTIVYSPVLMVVVARVIGIYTFMLFGKESNIFTETAVGFAFVCISYLYNMFLPKFGGAFQSFSTVVKLLPLIAFAAAGLIWGDPSAITAPPPTDVIQSAGWLTAIAPIAFSYDGWTISTSISHEIKNEEKNMPRALIAGPIIVLAAYVLYFTGVSMYIGPETIMSMGDAHVYEMAGRILGPSGGKVILIFVIISVMGTVNGIVLGFIRMPYLLALRGNVLPFSKSIAKLNKRSMPINSAVLAFALAAFWTLVHAAVTYFDLLKNSDISEVSVSMSYLFYIPLYYKVFELYRKGEIKNPFKGIVCPILGIFGAIMIFGGAMGNLSLIPAALIFSTPCLAGLIYYKKTHEIKK